MALVIVRIHIGDREGYFIDSGTDGHKMLGDEYAGKFRIMKEAGLFNQNTFI
jgi:hypothetical protein